MSNTENYFLPAGYRSRKVRTTVDHVSKKTYWTPDRIRISRSYQWPVYDYAARVIRENNIKTVADIGCGPAPKLQMLHTRFPDIEMYGIDQQSPIDYCRKTYNFGKWLVDDFEEPSRDVPDIKTDLVICADVIEHVIDPDRLLAYIRRKLAPGGLVILSTPDRTALYGTDKLESGHRDHVREWTDKEFALFLEDRGFRIKEHFHTFPVKPRFDTIALHHALLQTLRGRKWRYNQVCLVTPAD